MTTSNGHAAVSFTAGNVPGLAFITVTAGEIEAVFFIEIVGQNKVFMPLIVKSHKVLPASDPASSAQSSSI